MRIAVTGKQGQVVTALIEHGASAGVEIVAVGRPELDLAEPESVCNILLELQPDAIVSAAAYTAVDKAESESQLAFAVNARGPQALAEVAAELNIPVIHLSTDYVFPGDKDGIYLETDATGPVSVYGQSKLAGEEAVAAATHNHAILRTSWIYAPFGSNFVKTMLQLAKTRDSVNVVADQRGTPTSAFDIADAIIVIAKRLIVDPDPKLRGIFHLTSSGDATWADFAEEIFSGLKEKSGKTITVGHITSDQYPTPAKRPANSRLSGDKLAEVYGISLPDWKASTRVVLDRLLRETTPKQ